MPNSRVVMVTGASGGLGRACAEYLGKRGYRVYGTSRGASEGIVDAGSFDMVRMDVTDPASVARAVGLVTGREGRIDAVVNNAGYHAVGPLECVPLDEIEKSWRTNCLGAILVTRSVAPLMRAQGSGRIINLSSVGGVLGLAFQGAYSGSKFALEGMTESLRSELRPFGIQVCLIEPGDIRHQDCHSEAAVAPEYREAFARVMKVAWSDEEKGYPPERIGPLVERILSVRNPRTRYVFGQPFQSAVPILKRLLPNRVAEWAIRLYYHG
jgi:NAD(P)-dependent dehydrogenase (short-subunit alcohol dehydrogenase family)